MFVALQPGLLARRGFLRAASGLVLLVSAQARARAAQPAQVGIDNFTFAPTTLALGAGATVTWVNHDDIPHSIICPALGLKSNVLDTDQSFSRRFDQAGSFDYFCGIHPHMKGKLVVSA
jgi:plastocyanin